MKDTHFPRTNDHHRRKGETPEATGVDATVANYVTSAVRARLKHQDSAVFRTIVREVMHALAESAPVRNTNTEQSLDRGRNREDSTSGLSQPHRNKDGTITTGRGAIIPAPTEDLLRSCAQCVNQTRTQGRERAIVTATGINRGGVLGTVASQIADVGGDVEDVSQTIVSNFFTLIVVVNLNGLTVSFSELKHLLEKTADDLGVRIVAIHEDVMRSLQRI